MRNGRVVSPKMPRPRIGVTMHGENHVLRTTIYLLPDQHAALLKLAKGRDLTVVLNLLVGDGIERAQRHDELPDRLPGLHS